MKYIISESQKNFLHFIRRLSSKEMVFQMAEIVDEGLDIYEVCDYTFEDYLEMILNDSVQTLINSYKDTFKGEEGIELLKKNIYQLMKKRFTRRISDKFFDKKEEC
jgi:hypothetical protein